MKRGGEILSIFIFFLSFYVIQVIEWKDDKSITFDFLTKFNIFIEFFDFIFQEYLSIITLHDKIERKSTEKKAQKYKKKKILKKIFFSSKFLLLVLCWLLLFGFLDFLVDWKLLWEYKICERKTSAKKEKFYNCKIFMFFFRIFSIIFIFTCFVVFF